MARESWRVSLHGGHSGEFCEHATGTLREVLEAAVGAGFDVFGVSEHAPRSEARFVYDTELEKGYDVERLAREFETYAEESLALAEEFSDRLTVLRGFEAEIVPEASFREEMLTHRQRHQFEYMVGSVHYVNEFSVDGPPDEFAHLVESCGGIEEAAVRYYGNVARLVEALSPEVVGHLDLIRRNAPADAMLDTPKIRDAADQALEAVKAQDAILDLNTAGYRKGLGSPYPAPWLLKRADAMGIGFCFGDDSHGAPDVGAGIDQARDYLLTNGINRIRRLSRQGQTIVKEWVDLDAAA